MGEWIYRNSRLRNPAQARYSSCFAAPVKNRQLIHNLKSTKDRRKELRGNLTPVEALLWKCLQRSQLAGKKFRRQPAIGAFIVDFYCTECRLGVELDGAGHKTILGNERDAARDLNPGLLTVQILIREPHGSRGSARRVKHQTGIVARATPGDAEQLSAPLGNHPRLFGNPWRRSDTPDRGVGYLRSEIRRLAQLPIRGVSVCPGWPGQEGVAARSREAAQRPKPRKRGGGSGSSTFLLNSDNHPVRSIKGSFAISFLVSRPPLLARRGDGLVFRGSSPRLL